MGLCGSKARVQDAEHSDIENEEGDRSPDSKENGVYRLSESAPSRDIDASQGKVERERATRPTDPAKGEASPVRRDRIRQEEVLRSPPSTESASRSGRNLAASAAPTLPQSSGDDVTQSGEARDAGGVSADLSDIPVTQPRDYGNADVPEFSPGPGTGSPGSVMLRTVDAITDAYVIVGDSIGKGSFGEVLLGRRVEEDEDAQLYAIKRVKPDIRALAKNAAKKVMRASTVARRAMAIAAEAAERRRSIPNEESKESEGAGGGGRVRAATGVQAEPSSGARAQPAGLTPPSATEVISEAAHEPSTEAAHRDGDIPEDEFMKQQQERLRRRRRQGGVVANSKASGLREADIMNRVRGHENVVNMVDLLEDERNVFIVMDYCSGGDLMKYVIRCSHFSEKVASYLFKQMLLGVAHCHSRGVVHRDLKPENFLFRSQEGRAHLLIADFGLATVISHPDEIMTDGVGSAFFLAPEVLARRYTLACDVWSLGVILYLLLSGTVPFGARATKATEVYHAIRNDSLTFSGSGWANVSPSARELVAGLLEKQPYRRYTIAQALNHPWVRHDGVAPDVPLSQDIVSAMTHFNRQNRFRREALRLVASTLQAEDLQRLRAQFHAIDKDTDMTISYIELAQALCELGVDAGVDLEQLMREMDADGDGRIDLEEFMTATSELQMIHHQNNIWWAFCQYDRDNDGTITVDELREVLRGEKEDVIQKYIEEYDRDKDGVIDYEEFIRMLVPPDMEFQTIKFG